MRRILASLDSATSGAALARDANLSRYHACRAFRRALGESPVEFRRRLLLERAAYVLSRTRQGVLDVAIEAGYESAEAFARAFRRAYGVSPSHYRRVGTPSYRLPARSGIHFTPPGAPRTGDTHMDLLDRLLEHDLWWTRRAITRCRDLDDTVLDAPLDQPDRPFPFEEPRGTIRELLDALVATKEVWVAAMSGRPLPDAGDTTLDGLSARVEASFPEFARLARTTRDTRSWADTFVDAACVPPETFTFAGAVGHVVTFGAYRRVVILSALRRHGVTDLGFGDPIEYDHWLASGGERVDLDVEVTA